MKYRFTKAMNALQFVKIGMHSESGTFRQWIFRQRTFCQDVQNVHFANFYFPPLDQVDGVEYTSQIFISNYKSVQFEGCHLDSY